MNKLHVKRGDSVIVIAGKNKGSKGKIMTAIPKDNRVIVDGVNMIIRHTKPKQQGQQGGRVEREAPINASNVMLVCGKCNKATRVGHVIKDGKSVRVCKKCGSDID